MSVGRPYFDRMAVPMGVSLLLLMGVGPALPWGRATPEQMRSALLPPAIAGAGGGRDRVRAWALRPGWTLVDARPSAGFTAYVTLRELWRVRWRVACRRTARASATRSSSRS